MYTGLLLLLLLRAIRRGIVQNENGIVTISKHIRSYISIFFVARNEDRKMLFVRIFCTAYERYMRPNANISSEKESSKYEQTNNKMRHFALWDLFFNWIQPYCKYNANPPKYVFFFSLEIWFLLSTYYNIKICAHFVQFIFSSSSLVNLLCYFFNGQRRQQQQNSFAYFSAYAGFLNEYGLLSKY